MELSKRVGIVAMGIGVLILVLYAICPARLPDPPPYATIGFLSVALALIGVLSFDRLRRHRKPPSPGPGGAET